MYDAAVSRISPFAHLWPWPGNVFLFLFGVWAFYMGTIAELSDVKTAFYGLTGVSALLFVFGLRTIGRRPLERVAPLDAVQNDFGAVEEVHERYDVAPDIDDEDDPQNERAVVTATLERPSVPQETTLVPVSEYTAQQTPAPAARVASSVREESLEEEVRDLTAMVMRERAERGAALSKVESDVRDATESMRGEIATIRAEWAEARDAMASLTNAGPPREEGAAPIAALPDLSGFLQKDEFNRAVNQRLLPTIEERIGERIADAINVDDLRTALAARAETADETALATLRAELGQARELAEKALRKAADGALSPLAENGDLAADELLNLVKSSQSRLQSLEAVLGVLIAPGPADQARDSTPSELAARLRSRFDGLGKRLKKADDDVAALAAKFDTALQSAAEKASDGGEGDGKPSMSEADINDRFARIGRRINTLAQTGETVDGMKTTLDDVMSHVSRMGEHYQELSQRVDAMTAAPPADAPIAGTKNEVAELRDALSFLINESRELRAQRGRDGQEKD